MSIGSEEEYTFGFWRMMGEVWLLLVQKRMVWLLLVKERKFEGLVFREERGDLVSQGLEERGKFG